MKPHLLAATLLTACLTLTAPCVQAFTYINDGFSSLNYTFNSIPPINPDDLSSSAFLDFPTGGNPTFYRNIAHTHESERELNGDPTIQNGLVTHQSFLLEDTDTYQPSSEGAIQTLNFSIDVRSSRSAEVFFAYQEQAGFGYFSGFTTFSGTGVWQSISVSLSQGDFASGADFATAAPLRFGFGFFSRDDVTVGPTSYSFDVDNFRLNIIPVPEPSAALFAVLGSAALLLSRHRA